MSNREIRYQAAIIRDLVGTISRDSSTLNLSAWARALARTADHVGVLLCGDVPAAVRFAQDSGSGEHIAELIEFSCSSAYLKLRSDMGLSIDV